MPNTQRKRKVKTRALVRQLNKKKTSPNTPLREGYRLMSKLLLDKNKKGGKKSKVKTRKSKK